MVKWGSTTCTQIKWGSTVCTEVYWGSTKVFPDEVVLYNGSNNVSDIFTTINCDLSACGAGGSVSLPGAITNSNYGWNCSNYYYDSEANCPALGTSNPYRRRARSTSLMNAAQYTINTNNITMWGINGKRGGNDGYYYSACGSILVTKSSYNLSGKSAISLTYTCTSGSSLFTCGLTSLPSSYTSKFAVSWCYIQYTGYSGGSITIPSSGTYYIMIGIAACAWPDCSYNDEFTAVITKIAIT